MDIISVVQDFFASQKGQVYILVAIIFLYSSLKVFILRNSVTSGVEILAIASVGLETLILPAIVGTLAHFGPQFTIRLNPGLNVIFFSFISLFWIGMIFGQHQPNFFKNILRFFSYFSILMAIMFVCFEFGPSYKDCEPIRSANLMVDFLDPNHLNGLRSALLQTDPDLRWLEWICSY